MLGIVSNDNQDVKLAEIKKMRNRGALQGFDVDVTDVENKLAVKPMSQSKRNTTTTMVSNAHCRPKF